MEIDHAKVGIRVRMIREGSGASLEEVARRAGISDPFLSLLERGKRSWTYALYRRVTRISRSLRGANYGRKARREDRY